ncbi:MAG TPA: protein kinase [Gemmatimonadales bacterium]|nr:protein kinase [Gemmatimonadales bacterium]
MNPQHERLAEALADRYRLERPLGQGGMATVHLALDLKHHRKVAVKVLRSDFGTAVGAERFLREIEIAAALNHPHILAVHDSGEAAGLLYYVTPYVEGKTLRDRLQRDTRLPLDEALQIVREVADALEYAHQRGVVHRDIKPENILFQSGHAVVADFGIARAISAAGETRSRALTQPGAVIGTPDYMSPEQASGERELDGRSDQYALACVLYEMLAGQPPFTGPTMESILLRHLTVAAPRITDFQPDVPKPVAAALTRALAKAPAERFSGMAAFVEAIEAPDAPAGAPPPAQLTSFIGRERETAAVQELLQGTRLLTLTGAGGSGKTRLALEVASRVGPQYRDGVAWVELAALSNPELVPHHVADALGVRRDGIRSAGDALLEALRDWEALLVLDNCEHLVEACARLAEALLRGCPRLRIMATSREALGIGGERAWLVPALTLPEGGKPVTRAVAAKSEAVRLLVERSQAVRPSLELIDANAAAMVHICRRLDGLPLAIELAAARARMLDPQQIAARLDDVFGLLTSGSRTALPHHRTLRSTIEWSHALLTQQEQILFRRLAVFAGGFTIDAVETVAQGGGIAAKDVLDLLSGLVDKSLVLLETDALEARYRMLETIRQFARERLEQAGEAADLGRRHAQFFLARAEAADPFLPVHAEGWQERLADDVGNLRAAADWFEQDATAVDDNLRFATALHWFWFGLGHYREARRRLETALERSGGARTRARGRALSSLATYFALQGERLAIGPVAEESVAILREAAGPSVDLVCALVARGQALLLAGDLEGAARVLSEALDVARAVQPRYWITYALYWQGCVAHARGDLAAARAAFDEGVALALEDGYNAPIAHLATMRGRLALAEGDNAGALGSFAIGLARLKRTKNHWSTIILVEDLARIAADRGDAVRAARLLGAAANLREEAGAAPLPLEREILDRLAGSVRASLGVAAFEAAFEAGQALSLSSALDLAESMVGQPAGATRPAGAARPAGAQILRVNALGPLEISLGGEALPATSWTDAKPRELLLYLLCHPAGRTGDQIGLALWRAASPAQRKNDFHVTLHQLRRTLGRPEWIVFEEDRYRINPRFAVEFDARQFETDLRMARAALAHGKDAASLTRALALYRGDFLEDVTAGDWCLEHRDRWRRLYVEGKPALGEPA